MTGTMKTFPVKLRSILDQRILQKVACLSYPHTTNSCVYTTLIGQGIEETLMFFSDRELITLY